MPTITTKDGVEIFYKDCGSGQRIVFSHGWPLSADDWDNQMLLAKVPWSSQTSTATSLAIGVSLSARSRDFEDSGGSDGTRTRGLLRDRQAF